MRAEPDTWQCLLPKIEESPPGMWIRQLKMLEATEANPSLYRWVNR